jgi:hypothetical protein
MPAQHASPVLFHKTKKGLGMNRDTETTRLPATAAQTGVIRGRR